MKQFIYTLLIASFLMGCQDIESCSNNHNLPFMIVRFFDVNDRMPKKAAFEVNISSGNEFQYEYFADSTAIRLGLNPPDTSLAFRFDSAGVLDFELQIRYDVELAIFDPLCNPSIYFVGIDTLKSTFDSTVVAGNVTNRQVSTNVEVYY